jgi:predicted metalloprotease with PDZ domain
MVRISRLIFVASLAASTLFAGEPRCSGSARDCDRQIRHMLSGRRYLGATIDDHNPGLVVKAVHENGPAARNGLKPGDRLIALNGKSLTQASAKEFKQLLADARDTGRLFMIISRRNVYQKLEIRLEPYTKEQISKIITAHLAQSHTAPADAGAH